MSAQQLQYKRVRVKVNADLWNNFLNVLDNASPRVYRGNDTQFEIGIFYGDELIDASNIALLTLSIWNAARTTRYATQTITAEDITAVPASAGWTDGTAQHAVIQFSAEEMNWALPAGQLTENCHIVLSGVTDAGKTITYGISTLTIIEDADGNALTPPSRDPTYYTQTESDARFIPRQGDGYTFRVRQSGGNHYMQFYVNEHWYSLIPAIVDGHFTFTPGPPED